MRKILLPIALSLLLGSVHANEQNFNVPDPAEVLKEIIDLDSCIDQSVPYFTDNLFKIGVDGYASLNQNFTTLINNWLDLLSQTKLSTSEKLKCIERSVERVRTLSE